MATVENSFQYRGDLSQTALPEILYTIDRFQVPGVIEASREGVVKQVYIKEGNVVHATSTDRADSLGSYLQRGGIISPDLYLETMRERERTNKRYGVLLIENGILSPADVYRAIRKQIENIVWSLFYWQDGSVIYSIGELPQLDAVRIQIPMRQVVLQGIKRAPDAKTLVARLGRKETVLEPCYKTEQLIELALDGDEYKLLSLVDVVDHISDHGHLVLIDFVARWTSGEPVAGDDAVEACFVSLTEACERVSWEETRRVIRRAVARFGS